MQSAMRYDDVTSPVTAIVVEDDPFAQRSLAIMLEDTGVDLVASYSTGEQCCAAVAIVAPQVALVDMSLGGMRLAGVQVIREILTLSPTTACMVLTAVDPKGELLPDALYAGARGYYRKGHLSGDALPGIIKALAAGEWAIEPELATRYIKWSLGHVPEDEPGPTDEQRTLSGREREVLTFVLQGLSSKQIGRRLDIAESTVKQHRENAAQKLGFGNNSHLAAIYAGMKGLLNAPTHPVADERAPRQDL